MLAPGGQLLFVTPVGQASVHFNAHRIYAFEQVMALFPGLALEEFALITDKRDGATFVPDADPARWPSSAMAAAASCSGNPLNG